jgi:antitoxin MazE
MNLVVRSKVIKIGNSRGIRIPRGLLEQAGLVDDVEMTVLDGELVIHSAHAPRQGWEQNFARMAEQGDDTLLDSDTTSHWDEEEWAW